MTFAVLRALHAVMAEALDDMERCFGEHSPSFSPLPTPSSSCSTPPRSASNYEPQGHNITPSYSQSASLGSHSEALHHSFSFASHTPHTPRRLDFPSPDAPYDASSPSEQLMTHPEVVSAITRVVAACGQMSTIVQAPFLSLCDASMGYHLPSCMRFLEATHTVEILREAGPNGLHVTQIAHRNGTDVTKLGHILRLLATHHILREVSPNVFANTRISSCMDTGKSASEILTSPDKKYEDTNGIAAFVGLCTDELFKSSAYLTEAYALTPHTKHSTSPTHAPFNFAFRTEKQYFPWLEDGDERMFVPANNAKGSPRNPSSRPEGIGAATDVEQNYSKNTNSNRLRLERFGKAMAGTGGWEAPGAILSAFNWSSLAPGSVVVDVGGGIGSTSMLLAEAFSHLKFVVQDRAVVVEMGAAAWRARCPELLDSGRAAFQVHDFFAPQPVQEASVFLLRVVLHDWPDAFAQRILLQLRDAATEGTKLVIADHVLPLACADDFQVAKAPAGQRQTRDGHTSAQSGVEGVERQLAHPPLLANLGKASANAYWMDMTMQVIFNGQERTLREIVALALSAGWKVVKVARTPGSLFGHIVAVPVAVPPQTRRARSGSGATRSAGGTPVPLDVSEQEVVDRSVLRSGTPTFGSSEDFYSVEDVTSRNTATASRRPLSPLTQRQSRQRFEPREGSPTDNPTSEGTTRLRSTGGRAGRTTVRRGKSSPKVLPS